MGVRTGSRVNGNTAPPSPPEEEFTGSPEEERSAPPELPERVSVDDGHYRGKNPDQLSYRHTETLSTLDGQIELRAFTGAAMAQLRRIAEEQLLPTLRLQGLGCATLCQMPERNTSALGACFGAGQAAARQQIMLHHPDAERSDVSYTLLHEVAHLTPGGRGHGDDYRAEFGRLLDFAVGRGTPFTERRADLLRYAEGDTYAPPTPVRGSWGAYERQDSPRGRTPVLKRALRHRSLSNVEIQPGGASEASTEAGA